MNERLPIFPLRTVLFPGDLLPLHVFEPRYRLMLSRRAGVEPCFGVVLARSGSDVGDQPEVHEVGTSAISVEQVKFPDGRSNLLVEGARRFQILESDWDETYMVATVKWFDSTVTPAARSRENDVVRRIEALLASYLDAVTQATGRQAHFRTVEQDPTAFAYAVASTLPMPLAMKQQLLEAAPPHQLLSLLEETVRYETMVLVKTGASVPLPGNPGVRFTDN